MAKSEPSKSQGLERSLAEKHQFYVNAKRRERRSADVMLARRKELARSRRRKQRQNILPIPTRPMADLCECCGRRANAGKSLAIDHCWQTGNFRGWLCFDCNTGLGKLGDNIAGLQRAIEYLKRSEAKV